jgi:tetratricopeptide (TPR) repeat protein
MSETEKRKIRVFIASPNDLAEERRKFREAIDVLNIGFGDGANVEFLALGWEDTLASTGRRSQGVINQDIDSCDVFILAMHRRWGQKAPDAKPYSSYTEEEYYRAYRRWEESGKPEVFVFFKRVDAASEADPGPQLKKVINFRKRLEKTKKVLYRYFDSTQSFFDEVDRHLREYARKELPKAGERKDNIDFPIDVLQEVQNAKQIALQKTEEARQANDKAEIERLKRDALELQMAEDAAKLSKEGKIEFARETFTRLVTETTNIKILSLGFEFFYRTGDLDTAFKVLDKWLSLSGAENKIEETAAAIGNLALLYQIRGDLDRAEELHQKTLATYEALDQKEGMAAAYCNLGNVYQTRGELERAEKMFQDSLTIAESLDQKEMMANAFGNLGNVYKDQGYLDQAKKMYNKALEIYEVLGCKESIADAYSNIGNVYTSRGELDRAEEMHLKSLAIDEVLGRKEGMARDYGNLANLYKDKGDFDRAEEMYEKSIILFREIGSPNEKKAINLLNELRDGKSSSEAGAEE